MSTAFASLIRGPKIVLKLLTPKSVTPAGLALYRPGMRLVPTKVHKKPKGSRTVLTCQASTGARSTKPPPEWLQPTCYHCILAYRVGIVNSGAPTSNTSSSCSLATWGLRRTLAAVAVPAPAQPSMLAPSLLLFANRTPSQVPKLAKSPMQASWWPVWRRPSATQMILISRPHCKNKHKSNG